MNSQSYNHHALILRGILLILLLTVFLAVAPRGKATPDATVTMVYWTETATGKIMRGNADGSGSTQTCVNGQKNPRGLVIANNLGKMYWIERDAGRLRRANLDCPATGVETIGPALSNADRLALDLAGGKIYWTENAGTNRIRRADLNGENAETILSGLSEPVGIAVDRTNGYLYWTEFTSNQIWRSSLTGANKEKILDLATGANPLDIVLDVGKNRMYWASGSLGKIYTASLNGSGVTIWRSLSEPRSIAIDVEGNRLYWADQGTNEIRRGNLDLSTNELLFNSSNRPLGVALLTGDASPCYSLTRTHSGQGNNPTASPGSSSGCGTGSYVAGQSITLTASPAAGWRVAGWSGTNNDGSTATTNTVNMPAAAYTVSVIYEEIPVACYPLTRTHSGQGNDPVASPAFSTGCGTGQYKVGQAITLTASPAADWRVAGWSGTNNDGSTSTTNTVTMSTTGHTVSVIYIPENLAYIFYTPLVTTSGPVVPFCFTGPSEQEPNSPDNKANGPLCSSGNYTGLPNDELDIFMFETTMPGAIAVTVSGHQGEGVQLQIYYGAVVGEPVNEDVDQNDGLSVDAPNGASGRYYILIYTAKPKPAATQRYTMRVIYP